MFEEKKNNQIVHIKNNSLAKVSNTLLLTDKLLHEIESRNTLPRDDFRISLPDYFFQRYLIKDFGVVITNDTVAYGEIKNIEEINCGHDHCNISSLKGIEHFTSLIKLKCWGNHITDLDVSCNTALTYLDCGNNPIRSLNVTQNTSLTFLECDSNQLKDLNIFQNTALTYLDCSNNELTHLDLSNNAALTVIKCSRNLLKDIDLTHNTSLTKLWCKTNLLTELDISRNTALLELEKDN